MLGRFYTHMPRAACPPGCRLRSGRQIPSGTPRRALPTGICVIRGFPSRGTQFSCFHCENFLLLLAAAGEKVDRPLSDPIFAVGRGVRRGVFGDRGLPETSGVSINVEITCNYQPRRCFRQEDRRLPGALRPTRSMANSRECNGNPLQNSHKFFDVSRFVTYIQRWPCVGDRGAGPCLESTLWRLAAVPRVVRTDSTHSASEQETEDSRRASVPRRFRTQPSCRLPLAPLAQCSRRARRAH